MRRPTRPAAAAGEGFAGERRRAGGGGGGEEIARCGEVEEFGGDETKAVAVKRVGVNGSERLTCGAHVSVSHGRL